MGILKSYWTKRRWNSFFFILEFIRILLDMFERRAVKLIDYLNHGWLSNLWISAKETTFLP